jgi:hypothetical protein
MRAGFLFLMIIAIQWSTSAAFAQEEPAITIKDVMKEAHKKPKELLRKVVMGKATDVEKQRLLELYKAMAKGKPPKGTAESWKAKSDLIVSAAQAVIDGKPDAARELTKATNCMGCHKAHKK